jgi:hypothetical protein
MSAVATAADQAPPEPPPTAITVRPAGPPVPALRYRIVPERHALISGNAAVFYHRAVEIIMQAQSNNATAARSGNEIALKPHGDKISQWVTGPIQGFPRDEARIQLRIYGKALREVELGAMRKTCDWEFDQRKEGLELELSEIQQMRSLTYLVHLQTRLAVVEGKTDEAIHWLQTGFAMGRHVSQGSGIIQCLVGIAMDFSQTGALEDLIQSPGTPNLYWALANRPRPFVDVAAALDAERSLIDVTFPGLRDVDDGPWTVERARKFSDELREKIGRLTDAAYLRNPFSQTEPVGNAPLQLNEFLPRLAIARMVAKIYPDAKHALLAQGRPAPEVDAMPAIQVATIETLQSFDRFRDEIDKWAGLPYWEAARGIEKMPRRPLVNLETPNPLFALFSQLLPYPNNALCASVRLERQLDLLQCLEAIRLYAAAHDGAFPPSLDAIVDAPPPLDPSTGKPFAYTVTGGTATLEALVPPDLPNPNNMLRPVRFVLKVVR